MDTHCVSVATFTLLQQSFSSAADRDLQAVKVKLSKSRAAAPGGGSPLVPHLPRTHHPRQLEPNERPDGLLPKWVRLVQRAAMLESERPQLKDAAAHPRESPV